MSFTDAFLSAYKGLVFQIRAEGVSRTRVLALVAAAEAGSEHPVAAAIVTAAKAESLVLAAATEFDAIPGLGIRATVAGQRVEVGADRFMAQIGVDSAPLASAASLLADRARTEEWTYEHFAAAPAFAAGSDLRRA